MLKQRILTALIAAPLFIYYIVFASFNVFLVFSFLLCAAAAWEMGKLLGLAGVRRFSYVLAVVLLGIVDMNLMWIGLASVLWLAYVPHLLKHYAQQQTMKHTLLMPPLTAIFIIGFLHALITLRLLVTPPGLMCAFIAVWMNDIGAYFVGRAKGKHLFAPRLSPKKTWEGFFGGVFLSLAFLLTIVCVFLDRIPVLQETKNLLLFIGVSAIILVYANLGDLFESMLKRVAGVKDSGTILPGHGGILDRCDSWFSALPLWAVFFTWLGM